MVAEDGEDPAPTSSAPAPAPEGSDTGEQALGFVPSRSAAGRARRTHSQLYGLGGLRTESQHPWGHPGQAGSLGSRRARSCAGWGDRPPPTSEWGARAESFAPRLLCLQLSFPKGIRREDATGVLPTPAAARPHLSRQSWSSSQWDTAEKDKRKDSKNKTKTAQCPIPLKTEVASEMRPSAKMGAEAEAAGTRENLTMQLILALT